MAGLSLVLEALFPRSCVHCGREGLLCCDHCRQARPFTPPEASVDHVAAFAYGNPLVRDLLKAWKYEFDVSGWHTLRDAALDAVPRVRKMLGEGTVAIVPIPLSSKRLRERGFNQSMVIARWLGRELDLPVVDALARKHSATHQAGLSTEARLELSTTSPFLLKQGLSFSLANYDTILLVDDVFTTGATIAAARSVLSEVPTRRIMSFTLAQSLSSDRACQKLKRMT